MQTQRPGFTFFLCFGAVNETRSVRVSVQFGQRIKDEIVWDEPTETKLWMSKLPSKNELKAESKYGLIAEEFADESHSFVKHDSFTDIFWSRSEEEAMKIVKVLRTPAPRKVASNTPRYDHIVDEMRRSIEA